MCQMPNIWHIYRTKHQKHPFIRCVKCAKLLQHATVLSQFWHGTDRSCIIYITILFSFSLSSSQISLSLSVFSSLFSFSSLSSLFVFHSTPITNGRSMPPISPKTTTRRRRPSVFSISLRVLFFFFFPFFFFLFTFFGCGLMDGFEWADWWWVGSGCGLWQWVG